MNKLSVIFLCIVVGLGSSILGYSVGQIKSNITQSQTSSQTSSDLISRINSMPEGSEITIEENELQTVVEEKEWRGATSEKIYFRAFSWFGLGGPEAAAGDQGIQNDNISIGKSKGQSWITGLWNFVKSIFWFIVLYFAIWLILSAVSIVWPPAGVIAGIMAAIATGGISAISGLITWVKTKKTETALVQTVQGVDAFKAANPDAKDAINNELKKAQDSNSKDVIDVIRK